MSNLKALRNQRNTIGKWSQLMKECKLIEVMNNAKMLLRQELKSDNRIRMSKLKALRNQ
jgi:hypothetical protein